MFPCIKKKKNLHKSRTLSTMKWSNFLEMGLIINIIRFCFTSGAKKVNHLAKAEVYEIEAVENSIENMFQITFCLSCASTGIL